MSKDLALRSGSPTAMAAQARADRVDKGVRNLQIFGALSLYQGHQLSKSVENLNANLEHQTALLQNIAGGIGVVASKIDDVKREQVMLRLKQEREDLAKETIFQFKQECDRLTAEPSAFPTYFHYRALWLELEESGISTRDLPTIADKQYLTDVEAAIDNGLERTRDAFSEQEEADFATFEELVDYEFDDLEELEESRAQKLARTFKQVNDTPHLVSRSDLEEALGPDLIPSDFDSHYKKVSYLWWPLVVAGLVAGISELTPGPSAPMPLVVLAWLAGVLVVFLINARRRFFPSSRRLRNSRESVLERIRQDHSYTFKQAEEDEDKLRSALKAIEVRQQRARAIVSKHSFLEEALQPYFDFRPPKVRT